MRDTSVKKMLVAIYHPRTIDTDSAQTTISVRRNLKHIKSHTIIHVQFADLLACLQAGRRKSDEEPGPPAPARSSVVHGLSSDSSDH
jgi:hypothetical protein